VLCHCHSVDSNILDTTSESFDLHFAVNARASWLFVREFGRRYRAARGHGRIVALTSDHVAGNLPYGASKGALDRIVLAAAREFRDLGIVANVVIVCAHDLGFRAYLSELIVAQGARGQGIGRNLVERIQAELARRGRRILIADVWHDAEPFYHSLGWEPPDVVLLRRKLGGGAS
jgi:3-oxoacyl-[acyl-carrier protein] reductase